MFDFGMLSGLGSALGGLGQLFGLGYKDPTKDAKNMIGKIPGATQGYMSPYSEAGKGAMSNLQNQYGDLLGGQTYDKLASGYKESPGYKFALEQALGAGSNAAAAGGMLGTPAHEQQNMSIGQGLAAQDFDKYMQSQMGLYGMGLQGEQGLNQMGYNANQSMSDTLANSMSNQAQLDYAGKAGRNAWNQGGWQNLFGGLSGLGQNQNNQQYMQFMQQLMQQMANKGGTA